MDWCGMTLVKKAHNDRLQKELGLGDIDKKKCPDILFFPVILTTLIIDHIFQPS